MTADDWEPLPPEQLCAHPGEWTPKVAPAVVAAVPAAAAAPAPVPAPAPVAEPEPPPPDPAAEQALAALKQRLQAKGPAHSLIAEAQHREQRQQRRQAAARSPELQATMVHGAVVDPTSSLPPATTPPPPEIEYERGLTGRDPREEEWWFLELPPAERQRLQQVWAQKRLQGDASRDGQRVVGNRRTVAAVIVFTATMLLGQRVLWHATLGAGICCAIWWRHSSADRFLDPLRALLCLFVLQGLAMAVHGTTNPTLFMDSVLLTAFAAMVGFDGEIRRTGGFDAR